MAPLLKECKQTNSNLSLILSESLVGLFSTTSAPMTLLRQTCQLPRSWRYLNWSTNVRYNSAALFETRRVNLELQKGSSTSRFFTKDVKAALKNFGDIKDAPPSALTYGISGLIPFASIPAYMISSGIFIPELAYCNLAYGAVILSFLGGIRWGSSLPCPEVLVYDFIPNPT